MRTLGVLSSFGLLAVLSATAFSSEPQWVEVRSPNFSVVTDAGEKRGRDVALHFEQMRSVFGTLMTKANVNLAVPLQIVAFRNTKEMRQFAPIFKGKPTEVAGLFQSGEDRSFIMLDMSVDNPWSVVFHEYAHQLMNGNLAVRTDPWFEEGFAEYFASIEVDNKEARVGKIPWVTYQVLQQSGTMRVADLFRVQHYSKTYNESGDHRNTFYAESGLVVHYLYDNLLIPKLAVYFDVYQNQKKSVEQATQQAFGMPPEQFDKVLRDYLRSGRFKYYPIPTPASVVPQQFTVTAVPLADAKAVLADIHLHSPDYQEKALAELQEVLQMQPGNAAALRGLGYLYLQRRELDHAAEYFRQASQHDSKDPRVHYYNAMLLNRRSDIASAERTAEMKKECEAAIALDPKLADAYALLGFAQLSSGEQEKGLQAMKKAVELSPRNEGYQFNLAKFHMMNRQRDEAAKIFKELARSDNPEIAARANSELARAESYQLAAEVAPQLGSRPAGPSDSKFSRSSTERVEESGPAPAVVPSSAPVHFMKGKVTEVDCSASPKAVLSVLAAGKTRKMYVENSAHVIVIGADGFSCSWKNVSVAVNYRDRSDGGGDVMSVELQ
ncbi:MAG TPA: tetratricopeptide repeat protein [Terriglobales bacterium]|nr:tetratricopeptide repeat protein [Terriglobales bacterium]